MMASREDVKTRGGEESSDKNWLSIKSSNWDAIRIKHGFAVIGSGTTPPSNQDEYYEGDIPWVNTSEIRENVILSTEKTVTSLAITDYSALKIYPKGALVIAMYGATIGRVGILGIDATVNQAVCVLGSAEKFAEKFVFYCLQASRSSLIAIATGGGQPNLNAEKVREHKLPCPDLPTQCLIANYLDRETAHIDALIAEKEHMLALLEEKRAALISQAVTRGLDPDVPLKPSGLDWLGDIPAHWEVGALKRFWAVTDCKHVTAEFVEGGIPLASIREVQAPYVDLSKANKTTEYYFNMLIEGERQPLSGDILYSRNATVGEAAMVTEGNGIFAMGQDICLLRKITNQDTRYLYFQLHSSVVKEQLESLMVGSTFRRINVDNIKNYVVIMPPFEVQRHIADFLEEMTFKQNFLRKEISQSITLLKERRSALITAAVTGQIDPKEMAA